MAVLLAIGMERVAHHALRGQVWDKAVGYLREAGAKAFARSANREALTGYEQALGALAHLPATRETAEQGIDLRFDLRTVLFVLGELGRADEVLAEADGLARALDDARRLGWLAVYKSLNRFTMDQPIQQRAFAEQALAMAETLSDVRLQVAAHCLLGTAMLDAGEYREADTVFRTVVASLDDDLARDRCGLHMLPAVWSRLYGARALAESGAFDQGIASGWRRFVSPRGTGTRSVWPRCAALWVSVHPQGRIQPGRRAARTRARVEP